MRDSRVGNTKGNKGYWFIWNLSKNPSIESALASCEKSLGKKPRKIILGPGSDSIIKETPKGLKVSKYDLKLQKMEIALK